MQEPNRRRDLVIIPPILDGHKCDSTAEARWEVLLRNHGLIGRQLIYSPDGFRLHDIWYRPDFLVQPLGFECFLEIKPKEPTEQECQKAAALARDAHLVRTEHGENLYYPNAVFLTWELEELPRGILWCYSKLGNSPASFGAWDARLLFLQPPSLGFAIQCYRQHKFYYMHPDETVEPDTGQFCVVRVAHNHNEAVDKAKHFRFTRDNAA